MVHEKRNSEKKTVSIRSFFFHASVRVHKIISVFGEKFHLTQINIFYLFFIHPENNGFEIDTKNLQ